MITASRQRVLDCALLLFSAHGYAGTSMRDLADALGLQPASLYSHYRSKDQILAQVLEPLLEGLQELLSQDDGNLLDWLDAYGRHLSTQAPAARIAVDLAARTTPVGQQLLKVNNDTRARLRRITGSTELEAAAELGRLWWPLICLDTAPTPDEVSSLTSACTKRACLLSSAVPSPGHILSSPR